MDLKFSSLRADQTRRVSIDGLRINDNDQDLVLIVRWTGASKEYQDAIANKAFQKLSPEESEEAIGKLLAKHIVVDWENVPKAAANARPPDGPGAPIVYTPERGAQVFEVFRRDGRLDRQMRFIAFVSNGDNFQRSIDAEDLGNG